MDYNTLYFILFLLSAICFLLTFLNSKVLESRNLISLGLFLWVLVPLIQTLRAL